MDSYKKKYKEALERAKIFKEHLLEINDKGYADEMNYIFPELKKSEDEESKKWILEYLYDGLRKSDEQFKGQFNAAIAWLEKQGEQADYNPYKATIESIAVMVERYADNGDLKDFYDNINVKCKDARIRL